MLLSQDIIIRPQQMHYMLTYCAAQTKYFTSYLFIILGLESSWGWLYQITSLLNAQTVHYLNNTALFLHLRQIATPRSQRVFILQT